MTSTAVDRGRRRRRLGVLVVAALLLTLGACTGFDVWAGSRLDAEIARLEARYGKLDESTLNLPPVLADDNRARIVRAAAALTVPIKPYFPFRVSSPVPDDLRAFVEANRPAIRLVADLGERTASNWDVEYGVGGNPPPWMDIKTLSDAIYVAALLDLEAGRLEEASTSIASGLAVAASVRQEPDVLAQLMRSSLANRHIGVLKRLITQAEPSRAALEGLARWLAENHTPDPMRVALPGEMKHVHAILTRMENGEVDRNTALYIYPETWPSLPQSWMAPLALLGQPIVKQAHIKYLQKMGRLLEIQAGPRPRSAFPPSVSPRRWELVDRLVEKFTSGVERSIETGDDFDSEVGTARIAVALRRYKLDRGAYPDELSALAPMYLAVVPLDPYTGQPPVYTRQGDGFTLRAQNARPESAEWWTLEWTVAR